MSKEIRSLADFLLHDPQEVKVTPKQVTVEKIAQFQLRIANEHKQAALEQMLKQEDVRKVIVFTRTKHASERITKKLLKAGFSANAINGNKSQNARAKALDRFKRGADWILVATDVAARGIDIQGISHVINFELPQEPENYVHRIGRTARAGLTGVAWSLVDPSEKKQVQAIEKMTHSRIAPLDFEVSHALPIEAAPELEPARKFKPDQKKKSAPKRKWPPKRKGPGDAKASASQAPGAKPRRRPRRKPKKAA
jgi:ATP-dependent RNA helicase RhlE